MFTGIIEKTGLIKDLFKKKTTKRLIIFVKDGFDSVKKGASIAVNGVCLTAVKAEKNILAFNIMEETLKTTTLSHLRRSEMVNLERAVEIGARLDGHFVLGHIDGIAKIKSVKKDACPYIEVSISPENKIYAAKKGSVAIDGISLTISELGERSLRADIIPYTLAHTNLKYKKTGDWVNIEYDILGKYIYNSAKTPSEIKKSSLTESFLKVHGFI